MMPIRNNLAIVRNKASLSFGRTSAGIVCYFWGSFGTIEGIYFSSVSIREIPHLRLYIQGNRNAHKLKRITFDGGRRRWEVGGGGPN